MKTITLYILVCLAVATHAQTPIDILLGVKSSNKRWINAYFNRMGYSIRITGTPTCLPPSIHSTKYFLDKKNDERQQYIKQEHYFNLVMADTTNNKFILFNTSNDTLYRNSIATLVNKGFNTAPYDSTRLGTLYISQNKKIKIELVEFKSSSGINYYSFYFFNHAIGFKE